MQRNQTITILEVAESGLDLGDGAWNTGQGAGFNFNPFLTQYGGEWSGSWKIYGELAEEYEHRDLFTPYWPYNPVQYASHVVKHQRIWARYTGPDGTVYEMDEPLDPEDQPPPSGGGGPQQPVQYLGGIFDLNEPGVLSLQCSVDGSGHHTVSASFMGQPLDWGANPNVSLTGIYEGTDSGWYFEYGNPGAPNGDTTCHISTSVGSAHVDCTHGGDEAYSPFVRCRWQLPHRVRVRVNPLDEAGNPVTGKKVWVGFMPLVPESYDNPNYDHGDVGSYVHERTTPVDETFDYPLQLVRRQISAQHRKADWTTKPQPLPPPHNVDSLMKREWYSGLSNVAVAFDRAELGMTPAARPFDVFASYGDRREFALGRFHDAAGVTNMPVGKLTLPSTKSLPALSWTTATTGATATGTSLAAAPSESTFVAALAPTFEARPYRFLKFDATSLMAVEGAIEIAQGGLSKRYPIKLKAGASTVTVDTMDPIQITDGSYVRERHALPLIEAGNQAEPDPNGAVNGCFSGIGGITAVRLLFAGTTLVPSNFRMVVESSAEIRPLGLPAGGAASTGDDVTHAFFGQVDGRDAFRVPLSPYDGIGTNLGKLRDRQSLTLTEENYALPTWWKQYTSWQQAYDAQGQPTKKVPTIAGLYVSNFDSTLGRPQGWAGQDPRGGAQVRMTLLGQGIKIYPNIGPSATAMFRSGNPLEPPFEANFEFLWGSSMATTSPGSAAQMKLESIGTPPWSLTYVSQTDTAAIKLRDYGRKAFTKLKPPSDSAQNGRHFCVDHPLLPPTYGGGYYGPPGGPGGPPPPEIPKERLYLGAMRQAHWVGVSEDPCRGNVPCEPPANRSEKTGCQCEVSLSGNECRCGQSDSRTLPAPSPNGGN